MPNPEYSISLSKNLQIVNKETYYDQDAKIDVDVKCNEKSIEKGKIDLQN